MHNTYQSIRKKHHIKHNHFGHHTVFDSFGSLKISIDFYNDIIEIKVIRKDKFIFSFNILENSLVMWEPKPRATIGREMCLEIIKDEYPDFFEWCLWNL